ncbi:hypothetical protein [Brumimicrobium aurantiacum]|uniref:hypothetical protein n=1 Tax=Brumimicrobium aurantiacum TaxID=1737063 RepID=UPI001403D965|nr:hypothetical protein [Brumimicrobium aurantiacum]
MKYILLLLIFLFKINPCSADNNIPYLNLTNKAEYLYDQGKYLEAKWTFEEAF